MRTLITGASSGIGEAFARWYAAQGDHVILTGRSHEALQRITSELHEAGQSAEFFCADLSNAEGVESVLGMCGDIDVLIANAGVTAAATIGTTPRDELDQLAYLMTAGITRMCEALVPGMVQRGSGTVVIVSSIATFTPMRKAAPYAAAKTYATAYARSLALEVAPKGVRVTAVCPGYVNTDLHRRAGLDHLSQRVPSWLWLQPQQVILVTQRALKNGKTVVVPGFVYRVARPFLTSSLAQRTWQKLTRRR
jgi:hypothetical protein